MFTAKFKYGNLSPFILLISILVVYILSYWTIFQKLTIRWSTGDNNYCYLIFPLFLYFCWELKDRFQFSKFSFSSWGIIPITLAIAFILIGEFGSIETLAYAGLWGCIVGLSLVMYRWRIRYLIFPISILAFIVPLPPYINRILTFQLKMTASTIAVYMMRMTGISVFQDGNIIDIGISQLQVVDACSGLRYLMPLLLLGLLVGYFFSRGWWRRGILILLVVPLSVILNSFRIWVSGLLTVKGHTELVETFFHDFSGWVIFMIAGAILFGISLILNKIGSSPKDKPKSDPGGEPLVLKHAIALSTVVCLLFVSSGWAFKQIPAARNLPRRMAFTTFPMQIGEWNGKRSFISREILDQLWADDYVQATYLHPDTKAPCTPPTHHRPVCWEVVGP
jgi:exosortase D (VPLPA-CTERM-specific)